MTKTLVGQTSPVYAVLFSEAPDSTPSTFRHQTHGKGVTVKVNF